MSSVFDPAASGLPIRKAAQRMRWFFASFEEHVQRTGTATGCRFSLDWQALAEAFSAWLRAFEAHRPRAGEDRMAFVGFASGLMLEQLLRCRPARLAAPPSTAAAGPALPAQFWPEGYLCVTYCLKVRGLVIEHDFQGRQTPGPALDDIRIWWSFRENIAEDPALARPFLDLFAGVEPDWGGYWTCRGRTPPGLAGSAPAPGLAAPEPAPEPGPAPGPGGAG
jgi:hypothetical protein